MLNAAARRLVLAVGLTVLAGVSALTLTAQSPAAREKITFLAVGSDGQPIQDLKPAQIDLKIDGKPRPVQAVTLVKIAGASADAAPAAAAPAKGIFDSGNVPPPYGSNNAAPSRRIMIVIDEESMRPGADKPVKDALDQFVNALGAQDLVGVVTMPHGSVNLPLTASKNAVHDALSKSGGRLPPNRNDNDDVCHARDVVDGMTSLLLSLGEGPTSVVFVSSGLTPPSSTASKSSGATCDLTPSELDKVSKATSTGHATTYVVVGETNVPATEAAGLQSFAGAVGSPVLNLANPDPPLTRVLRESGNYYVAEFDSEAAEHDGKTHRVDLKLTAPGSVRAVSEVTFSKSASAKPSAKDIVKESKIYTDLPLRAVGLTSKGATMDKIKILSIVEPVDPGVKFSSMSIGLANLADTGGKITTSSLSADDLAKPMAVSAMEVPAGTYRMHVAAVDTTGRIGSVDYNVDATLTPAGPMKLSGLALGVLSPGFAPRMQYTDEPEAVAYFELYGTTQSHISVTVEVAETPDGPALVTGEPQLGQTSEPGRYNCIAKLDIKNLKPGDYVVRAIFGVEGTEPGKIVDPGKIFRTLRKVAK